jgi:hypothetical protein
VVTYGISDMDGVYQTEDPVETGQTYSVIVIANRYRPILADGQVSPQAGDESPYEVNATMRRIR